MRKLYNFFMYITGTCLWSGKGNYKKHVGYLYKSYEEPGVSRCGYCGRMVI